MAEREQLSVGELTLTGAVERGSSISVLMRDAVGDILHATSTTAPTHAAVGYAKGCFYIDTNASAGSVLFVNQGTRSSASWLAMA